MKYIITLILSEITVWGVMLMNWSSCNWHIMLGWSLICIPVSAVLTALGIWAEDV